MRKMMLLLLVVVLAIAAFPATAQEDMAIESVCLVTDLGRVNDGTFNQFAYEGMVRAVEEFGLESTFIETAAETDYTANIDTCVQEGFDAVVTVGFLIADATAAAAAANPDVYFIGVDQFVMDGPSNYVGIQFREDQAGFLVGLLAAQATESGIVAGVYGIDIPPVVKFRLGYEQGVAFGAAAEETEVEVLGVYIDSFVAPDRGASAAEQFIGEGADVIFGAGGPTGTGGIVAAAQQGVYVIGVDQDEYFTSFGEGETPGADKIISSALKRVDVGVYDMLAALSGGDMEAFPGGNNYVLDIANGGITFAPKHESDLPDEYYDNVALIEALIAAGDLDTGVDLAELTITTPGAELYAAIAEMMMEE
jgi:basic membrane lipoprotein Med (substrate-binding protein (PBP1-ABC) superfamily)